MAELECSLSLFAPVPRFSAVASASWTVVDCAGDVGPLVDGGLVSGPYFVVVPPGVPPLILA